MLAIWDIAWWSGRVIDADRNFLERAEMGARCRCLPYSTLLHVTMRVSAVLTSYNVCLGQLGSSQYSA